jgi:hypothetical protein
MKFVSFKSVGPSEIVGLEQPHSNFSPFLIKCVAAASWLG